jgi:hypothetical protein
MKLGRTTSEEDEASHSRCKLLRRRWISNKSKSDNEDLKHNWEISRDNCCNIHETRTVKYNADDTLIVLGRAVTHMVSTEEPEDDSNQNSTNLYVCMYVCRYVCMYVCVYVVWREIVVCYISRSDSIDYSTNHRLSMF